MKKKTPEQKKKELKPLSSIIQVCPVCGKIDVYKNMSKENKEQEQKTDKRYCKWCNDELELNDDLLCAACSYEQAFGKD